MVDKLIYNPRKHTFNFDKNTNSFFNIALQITRNCNSNCLHCCESSKVQDLSTKHIFKIIDNLSNSGVERVCLTGGEPTLRKDIFQIIDYLISKRIIVTLATNGLGLNYEGLQKLKGKISNLRVSIYGDEKTHDSITRIKGSFKNIEQTIKLAKEVGIPVYFCMSLMQNNLQQITIVARLCRKWGIEKLLLFSLMPKGRGKTIFNEQKVSHNEVMNQIKESKLNKPSIYWTSLIREGQCAMIHPNGDLVAAPYNKDPSGVKVIGNTLNESLIELWDKYPFKKNYLLYYEEKK